MIDPLSKPRRILLLVTGLSPQIMTETLHALCILRSPAFVPTEVHLLTISEGRERARLMLFEESQAHFLRFCEEYSLDTLQHAFTPENIEVVKGHNGRPLADILTDADNTAVADAIMRKVREFAADEKSTIHASVAGGRKTMGVAAGIGHEPLRPAAGCVFTCAGNPAVRIAPQVLLSAEEAACAAHRHATAAEAREHG